jgi:hypothetical protein
MNAVIEEPYNEDEDDEQESESEDSCSEDEKPVRATYEAPDITAAAIAPVVIQQRNVKTKVVVRPVKKELEVMETMEESTLDENQQYGKTLKKRHDPSIYLQILEGK